MKDKILYTTITILIVVLVYTSGFFYVKVIDNAIIFGIKTDNPTIVKQDPYANETLEETLARGDKLLEDTDLILADAKKRGFI